VSELHLHGLGHFHPDIEITNRFLQELDIGTDDAWILQRVGIRSRRTTLPLDYIRETRNKDVRAAPEAAVMGTAEMGARAAELAIARSGIDRSEIGMLFSGSCATDVVTPAEASDIARKLELQVPSFDVNSACTSFLAQLHLLSMMRPEALPPYVLVVAQESMSRLVDYDDRSTAVLFGDGAAAAVVSATVPGRARVLGTRVESNPAAASKVWVPRTGHFVQDGRSVQMFAIKKSISGYRQLKEEWEEPGRPFHLVGHQANLRMLETMSRRCGVEPELHHTNCEFFGNTGASSSAVVISQDWDKWTDMDDVAVVGVGAGLTWAHYLLRFGEEASP